MATATLNYDLQKTIRLLPGYDPYAQAGDCGFDEEAAQRYIEFIEECCTFTQGSKSGQPFILEPWEKAIVANLYGWKRPDGLRRYRTAFILVGRGNGKSELAAAMVCAALFIPDEPPEPGGHVFSGAAKREQTRYVFDPVCRMIRVEAEMNSRAEIYKQAVVVGDRSYFPMSRETHTGTEHGGAPAFAVMDEVHAHLDRRLIHNIESGMVKRRQPLMVSLSTSDFEREESPCNQLHDHASKVRDGVVDDPTTLPALFEAAKEDDWTSPDVWRKANPNLGVTIQAQDLAALCKKAQADVALENEFKRLHLNIRTEQAQRLIAIEKWDACQGSLPELSGRKCWCGLDLGGTSDLTAFAAAYPLDDGYVGMECRVWVPEAAVAKREQRGEPMYRTWVRQGFMTVTPGAEVDYGQVRADINQFAESRHLQELAVDRLFQGAQLVQQLCEEDGLPAFAHGQGFYGMALPMRAFMELVNMQKLVHDGNPVIRWMVANLTGRQDPAGNWKPDKKTSADKIDGVVAMIMAVGRATAGQVAPVSPYQTRGFLCT